ncbi:hypothetical protein BBJ28_00004886 [Nothophytophthora sp. Chile5]|nr:hypothetical protein BBJ28_00004886 [Nothophytophthora sp. Chile5]
MANGSGRQSDAGAIKMKHVKRIHEDDGNQGEGDEGADVRPMDARVMQLVLESMGADKFEPRVVAQLQEFVHRTLRGLLPSAYSTDESKADN